jgi:coenzyme F420 hydrogenase subunit beta
MGKGLKELREEVLDTDACTACGTCLSLCPQIISIGDRIAVIADCRIESGRCYRYCPRTAVDSTLEGRLFGDAGYGGPVGPYVDYCTARSPLSEEGGSFQYSGMVSALMLYAIEAGLIDRAIVTRAVSNLPVPISVRSKTGIINAAGSKFALSPTNKEVNRSIITPSRRVGVVTLPCQSTGLKKRQILLRDEGDAEGQIALNVGLFCTWAVHQRGWRSLVSRYIGTSKIKRVEIPPPPANVMHISTNRKRHTLSLDEVRQFVRPGCKVCLDMTAENADISVGMVEGQEGYNTVIIRTESGRSVVQGALASGYIELDKLDDGRWTHLNEASMTKKKRAIDEAEKRGGGLPYYRRITGLKREISSHR